MGDCVSNSFLILLDNQMMTIYLHSYVYTRSVWQGADVKVLLLWLGCLLQREHYIIRKSSFCSLWHHQSFHLANSLGRCGDAQQKQYRLLQIIPKCCNADMITHRTRHFCFPFPPHMHLQSPTRVENAWMESVQDWAVGSAQPASAGSLAGLFFCAVSCWCGCAKPVTHTLAGPLQTPTHHLGVVLQCPRKNEHHWK